MATRPTKANPYWLKPKSSKAFGRKLNDSTHLYKTKHWKLVRSMVLASEPICQLCILDGRITEATVVDHIVPIRLGGSFDDRNNLQSLCERCHNSKTAKESNIPTKY